MRSTVDAIERIIKFNPADYTESFLLQTGKRLQT